MFHKCVICGGRKRVLSIFIIGMFDANKYYFHFKCVRECLANPDYYTLDKVSKAISISKQYQKDKEAEETRKNTIRKQAKEQFEKIYSLQEGRNSDFLKDD